MNMAGMNVGAGGPVGAMMMNSNGPGTPSNANTVEQQKAHLNTCIYEYFLKLGMYDFARTLVKDPKFDIRIRQNVKTSPGRRKEAEMNGVDADAMDMDGDIKDDIPDDLPRPHLPNEGQGQGFLFEWFCIFSDLFAAQRNKNEATTARTYLNQTQRMRESQQNSGMPRQGMVANPNQIAAMRQMRANGMANGMTKTFTPQQLQQMQVQQAMMKQQQMQRDQPDMDMNGRPGTPADGENGGSPSKRPRLADQQFNGAMGPNGRVPGMPGAQQQMLMQSGFNPNMSQQFRPNAAMQQKAMQGQMNNAMMMNMANSGSPMLGPMPDNQFGANGMPGEIFNQRMPGPGMPGAPGAQGGNHALQDYQMQLMLLEQQNKKRLMMARQEQDSIGKQPDGSAFPGQVGMQPGMSPAGSRSGTSPNPTEQMKRGNPQLSGLPGSPAPGDPQGRSPGMNFLGGGMDPNFNAAMLMNKGDGFGGPGAPGMQPPNMANMTAMARAQQQGRAPGQFPGGQPMGQQPSQGGPGPMGTPGQRNEMPPPQAPAAGSANANRNQPTSPPQNQAPPTPSQGNKANPKKKGKEGDNKKKATKKNSVANVASDAEPAATPTPSTPITPHPPNNSFNGSANKGGVPIVAPNNAGPTSNPVAIPVPPMQNDVPAFGGFEGPDPQFNLDFSTLDSGDVLENFDFDSFLNNNGTGDDFTFDSSLNVDGFQLDPNVE